MEYHTGLLRVRELQIDAVGVAVSALVGFGWTVLINGALVPSALTNALMMALGYLVFDNVMREVAA